VCGIEEEGRTRSEMMTILRRSPHQPRNRKNNTKTEAAASLSLHPSFLLLFPSCSSSFSLYSWRAKATHGLSLARLLRLSIHSFSFVSANIRFLAWGRPQLCTQSFRFSCLGYRYNAPISPFLLILPISPPDGCLLSLSRMFSLKNNSLPLSHQGAKGPFLFPSLSHP
jgi:hypothetical protein